MTQISEGAERARNNIEAMKYLKGQSCPIASLDLGITTGIPPRSDVVFVIFVSTEKQVAGCVVAEPIKSAYPVVFDESRNNSEANSQKVRKVESWYSSSKAVPAFCGINRIWVASEFRRQKVASRMIDCLRCNFIYGHVVELKELAFTDPTIAGRDFAAAYTKTDHFLVYK
ncbi:N-acetyltransferase ESCO1-like [Uloborus diversus]|uniref:N-acetyltransferase ESCO1-like n=1 Tax=Uloborus diversus TaxID=327109 RepID=UPI00240A2D26|nr:N-acetyltransferase ESCO1-like [Uloborus diversus]